MDRQSGCSFFISLQEVFALPYLRICHCISPKRAFFRLNADVCHRFLGCTLQIPVTVIGHPDNRAFRYVKDIIVRLKFTGS